MSDSNGLMIGNGEIGIALGATAPLASLAEYFTTGGVPFWCRDVRLVTDPKTVSHYGVQKGVRVLTETALVELGAKYTMTLEKVGKETLQMFYMDSGLAADEVGGVGEPDYQVFNPFSQSSIFSGYAAMRIWDNQNQDHPRMIHEHFSFEMTTEGDLAISGEEFTTYQVVMSLTGTARGTVKLRKPEA